MLDSFKALCQLPRKQSPLWKEVYGCVWGKVYGYWVCMGAWTRSKKGQVFLILRILQRAEHIFLTFFSKKINSNVFVCQHIFTAIKLVSWKVQIRHIYIVSFSTLLHWCLFFTINLQKGHQQFDR